MKTIKDFKSMSDTDIISTFEKWMDNCNVLSMYYHSRNSTDSTCFDILPIALIRHDQNYFQLLAVKVVNSVFEMRRYNVNNISDISVAGGDENIPAWEDDNWEDVIAQKDNFFADSLDDALVSISWDTWNSPAYKKNEVSKKVKFFYLPSNPDVAFIPSYANYYHYMSKKTVELAEFNSEVLVVKEVDSVTGVTDLSLGDVVKINAPSDSAWCNLSFTVAKMTNGSDSVTLAGIDKNMQVYYITLSANYLVVKKKKIEVAKKKAVHSWD